MYFSIKTSERPSEKKRLILNYVTPVASVHRKQQFQKTFILMMGKTLNKIYLFTFP